MAIPNNYIDKITNKDTGESRIISPAADKVRVENENFEGADLDEVLDEVAQAIEDAGSGDGTVTGVKVGSTTYEPTEGVVDISPAIPDTSGLATKTEVTQGLAGKVDKVTGYDLSKNDYTDADKTKLANIEPGAEVNVINGIKANGASETLPVENGIVTLPPASAGGNVSVIQPDPADGTFIIRVGDTDYIINLNHQHPEYAPLVHTHSQYAQVQVVNGESNLPDPLDPKTIYGVKAGGLDELEMVVIGGFKFYGGGGTSTPVLRQPADDSTIDVGAIESGQSSVTKTITVKGKNLTQALTVAVTGTGYSVNKQSISAADANVGTTLTITCTNTDENAEGTLSIGSSEVANDCDLVANAVTYETLRGVKLTGTQWLQTDYKPNANTKVTMRLKFSTNSHTVAGNTNNKNFYFFACPTSNNNFFIFYAIEPEVDTYQILGVCPATPVANISPVTGFLTDDSTFEVGLGSFSFTPNGGSKQSQSTTGQTASMDSCIEIGHYYRGVDQLDTIFNWFDLTIYELTISENNVTKRHYVPKKRNNVPGLYDTENGTFISSKTSTELVEIPLT